MRIFGLIFDVVLALSVLFYCIYRDKAKAGAQPTASGKPVRLSAAEWAGGFSLLMLCICIGAASCLSAPFPQSSTCC